MSRLLILGAHPDDAEFHSGGLAVRYRRAGRLVKMVSVSNGGAGHHRHDSETLVEIRRREAAEAGKVIGCDYETWHFPDGRLQPTLELRERIIREIRLFRPDLVVTHRTCDYHPDHRAVGQAVQDASYLVTVPLVCADVPHLAKDPVVAYMPDAFTRPYPFQLDVLLDIGEELDLIVSMLARHVSQVFEFLPYNRGLADQAPSGKEDREAWLKQWYCELLDQRQVQWKSELAGLPVRNQDPLWLEGYEISEYAGSADQDRLRELFPGAMVLRSVR
jgi:LmbE family N-acetylglucosaminyl deacetylase